MIEHALTSLPPLLHHHLTFIICSVALGVSLVAQLVKNLPAMQETLVQLLGWKDPLEKG